MFGRCVINKTQISSFKNPCLRVYYFFLGIYQVHGDGCFDTGPISLSLTGNYPDVHHHGHKTLLESSQQICSEPALKRLHWKRIHLLLWSLRGYGKEVIGFIEKYIKIRLLDVTRRQTATTRPTRHLAKLSISILNNIWKKVFLENQQKRPWSMKTLVVLLDSYFLTEFLWVQTR